MRFEAVERLTTTDSERVLVVLEQQLRRKVSAGIEREGNRLILSGLGPSPRTINPSDTTVIDVQATEDETLINVESMFQASAFLGPVGQEEIVRGKLRRVFGATRQQLQEEQDWLESESLERSSQIRSTPIDSYKATYESSSQNLRARQAGESGSEHKIAEHKIAEIAPAHAETVAVEVKDKALPHASAAEAETSASSTKTSPSSSSNRRRPMPEPAAGDSGVFKVAKDNGEEHDLPEPNRGWLRWAVAAACLLAVVPFAWRYRPQPKPAQVIDLSQSSSASATAAKPTPPAEVGPEGALRQWELTERSTDAGAQSAYYAVPVQQYMWKHNVARRDLETMKQKEIGQRNGLWTMKMEDVDIKRNGDTASITMVKHIMEQPKSGGTVRERFIHSQLTMKNSLGIWWITSERDIYPKQVAKDDDEFNPDEGETPSWAKPSPAAVAGSATPSSASPN